MPNKYELFLDKNKKVKLSANEQGDLFAEANGKGIKLGADGLQAIAEDGSLEAIGGGGLEGDTFVYVSGAGTAAENGQELADAIETAKTVKRKETTIDFAFLSEYTYGLQFSPGQQFVAYGYDFTGDERLKLGTGTFQVSAFDFFTSTTYNLTFIVTQNDSEQFVANVEYNGPDPAPSSIFSPADGVTTPLTTIVPGTVVVAPGNYDITNATGTEEVTVTGYNSQATVPVLNFDASYFNIVSLTGSRDVNITGSLLISEKNIFLKGLVLEDLHGIIMSDNGLADVTGENLKVGDEALITLPTQVFEGKFKFSNCEFGDKFFPEQSSFFGSLILTGECNNCTFGDDFIRIALVELGGNVTLDLLNCNFGNGAIHTRIDAAPLNLTLNAKNCNFKNGALYWFTASNAICVLNIDSCIGNREFIKFTNSTISGRIVNTKAIVKTGDTIPFSFEAFEAEIYDSVVFDNCHSEMEESFGFPFEAANYNNTHFLRCSTAGGFWDPTHPVISNGTNSIRFCLRNHDTSPYTNFSGTLEEIPTL